ncbi:unnamed protein product, partial [Iphiclides podalirius]
MTEDDIVAVGTILSIISTVALIATWCLIPQWRTLLNYVTTNQIIAGTLHLSTLSLLEVDLSDASIEIVLEVNLYLFYASLCWSLCASMISYLKLVLIHPGKIHRGKRKATLFSYGLLFLMKIVTNVLIPKMFQLKKYSSDMVIELVSIYSIISLNMFVFIKVVVTVVPCCRKRMFKLRSGNIVSLIGVGFVCDVATSLCMLLTMFQLYGGVERIRVRVVMAFRLIPQALVVLFNKRSRDIWSKYLRRRRCIRLNNIAMQNIGV